LKEKFCGEESVFWVEIVEEMMKRKQTRNKGMNLKEGREEFLLRDIYPLGNLPPSV
jgi:hypothetical protein